MAPRVIGLLFLTVLIFTVIAGLATANMTKTYTADKGYQSVSPVGDFGEIILNRNEVKKYKLSTYNTRNPDTCLAWQSSRKIHMLYTLECTGNHAKYIKNPKGAWQVANESKRPMICDSGHHTYFFQIFRLTSDPVRFRISIEHPIENGCGFRGRIPLLPERETAIDVITDFVGLSRIQPTISLVKTRTPPPPPMYRK